MSGPEAITTAFVQAALGGNQRALRGLVAAITPSIQGTVARVCRSTRNEVDDLVQEVLILLLEDDGRRMRRWEPERGEAYLRTIAWNCAVSRLRNRSKYPPPREILAPEQLDRLPGDGDDQETELVRSRYRSAILVGLEVELSERELEVFELLMEGLSAREICEKTGTGTENAVHLVRQRIVVKARAISRRLAGETDDA
jgi:RNA polymerase sigma factor (sigma-70 family)